MHKVTHTSNTEYVSDIVEAIHFLSMNETYYFELRVFCYLATKVLTMRSGRQRQII